jgi:Domain of unknown function (DUF4402)
MNSGSRQTLLHLAVMSLLFVPMPLVAQSIASAVIAKPGSLSSVSDLRIDRLVAGSRASRVQLDPQKGIRVIEGDATISRTSSKPMVFQIVAPSRLLVAVRFPSRLDLRGKQTGVELEIEGFHSSAGPMPVVNDNGMLAITVGGSFALAARQQADHYAGRIDVSLDYQ